MGYRRLGRTNLMVSEIVLGGHFNDPRGHHFWEHFPDGELPAEVAENRTEVVSRCLDHGVNYVDITHGSEALAYGVALKGRRDRIYIAADDAAHAMRLDRHRNTESQMKNIESCLRKLGTDYLDVWRPQFKPTGGHRDMDMEMCVAVFEKARQQGKVRFLGMATHDRTWLEHVLSRFPQYGIVYMPYTLRPKTKPTTLQSIDRTQLYEPKNPQWCLGEAREELFQAARAHDTGIIAIKPFVAGLLFSSPPQEFGRPNRATEADEELARLTLACILSNPDISGVAVGMTSPDHVDNNVRASLERQALLDQSDPQELRDAVDRVWSHLPHEYVWLRQWENGTVLT